jgi:hypothetical protein
MALPKLRSLSSPSAPGALQLCDDPTRVRPRRSADFKFTSGEWRESCSLHPDPDRLSARRSARKVLPLGH